MSFLIYLCCAFVGVFGLGYVVGTWDTRRKVKEALEACEYWTECTAQLDEEIERLAKLKQIRR